MVDILIADSMDPALVPIAGNVSRSDLFAELLSMVIAHEAGHFLGGVHQDPNNLQYGIMDQFYDPAIVSGAGRDGIFGNRDDEPLYFSVDEYSPTAGVPFGGGVNDSANMLAFGMSTGTIHRRMAGLYRFEQQRGSRCWRTSDNIGRVRTIYASRRKRYSSGPRCATRRLACFEFRRGVQVRCSDARRHRHGQLWILCSFG